MKNRIRKDDGFHPLKKHLRMGFMRLHILWEIKKGETHGYDIMKKIAKHMQYHAKKFPAKEAWIDEIGTGEIYAILDSLEGQGYIRSEWMLSGKKPKKNYFITKKGEQSLSHAKAVFLDAMKNFELLFSEIFAGTHRTK